MKPRLIFYLAVSIAFLSISTGMREKSLPLSLLGLTTQHDTIVLINPNGEVYLDSNQLVEFEWAINFTYNGAFKLRILELDSNAIVPDNLPDTGLFFSQNGILGSFFSYPANAPAFKYGFAYLWQIETEVPVGASNLKSKTMYFFPTPIPVNCNIDFTGEPQKPICPGTCFTLQVALPSNLFAFPPYQHRFTLYTDHTAGPAAVTVNGQPAYDLSDLCGAPETPQAITSGGTTYNIEICILEGSSQPVQISLYYNRWSSYCNDQCSISCCHEVESFSIDVLDITDYDNIVLEIKELTASQPIHEICSGDPAHFTVSGAPAGAMPVWQVWNVAGGAWDDIVTFGGQAFPVGPNNPALIIDCDNSITGYEDKVFRAKFTITAPGGEVCEFITDEYPLRICCPLQSATLDVSPNVLLCEGDDVTFSVSLQSPDLFVQTPGDFVSIVWSATGSGSLTVQSPTNIEYEVTLPAADICFIATIKNCNGKERVVQHCVMVDPKPQCGTVDKYPSSANLQFVTDVPYPTYQMCPGKDGVLEAIGFDNCIITWEISPDNITWSPMGSATNTIQNTNTLFTPFSEEVYYRVVCMPFSNPSGCEPCTSNVVKVIELVMPVEPIIGNCLSTMCKGDNLFLFVSNLSPGVTYRWFCNGLEVGSGSSLDMPVEKSACYWVEASNGCTVVESEKCCINVCETVASISCPLPPNECACLGDPITLTAAGSYSTCPPGILDYQWSWLDSSGNPQSASSISITDTPPPSGSLYSLTVLDLATGCSSSTQLFIKPCNKN